MKLLKKKWFRIAISAVLALLVVGSTFIGLSPRVSVGASERIVSISVNTVQAQANPVNPAYQVSIPHGVGSETGLKAFPPKLEVTGKDNWLAVQSPDGLDVPVGTYTYDAEGDSVSVEKYSGAIKVDSTTNSLIITAGALSEKVKYDIEVTDYVLYGGESTLDIEKNKVVVNELRAKFRSYVYGSGSDLYLLENTPQRQEEVAVGWSRAIEAVRVYAYVKAAEGATKATAETRIGIGEKKYNGVTVDLTQAVQRIGTTYTVNPATGVLWTWQDIDDLQAGVTLKDGILWYAYIEVEDPGASWQGIPNVAGDETAIPTLVGAATHWEANISKDDDVSYVASSGTAFTRDLFNLEAPPSISEAIINVKVRAYVRGSVAGTGTAKTSIKTNGVVYDGIAQNVTAAYANIDTDYTTNPQTGVSWTWVEINALQAGVSLKRPAASQTTRSTYVLVIVYFTIGTQTFYPITPVEVTPGTADAWIDANLNGYLPAGATGGIFHVVNNGGVNEGIGLRKNGSTDARTDTNSGGGHHWAAMGVDANRIVVIYVGDKDLQDVWLVGYTVSGVTFFTNGTEKSVALYTWTDVNLAAEAPSAVASIWEIQVASDTDRELGYRMNGSSDARIQSARRHRAFGAIIGVDANQIVELYQGHGTVNMFLIGYITDGVTMNLNAVDQSLTATATWTDLPYALPANSVMGFIETIDGSVGTNLGLRKNGSAEDIYKIIKYHGMGFVESDASGIIEGEIAGTNIDFFEVGSAQSVAGEPAITVSPTSYNFGIVQAGSSTNTTTTYFTITNNSTVQTDQTISVTTSTWSGGAGWGHNDSGSPGDNATAILANRGGTWGTGDVIVKNAAPNFIYENKPAGGSYSFGLGLWTPLTMYDGAEKTITVRISAVSG